MAAAFLPAVRTEGEAGNEPGTKKNDPGEKFESPLPLAASWWAWIAGGWNYLQDPAGGSVNLPGPSAPPTSGRLPPPRTIVPRIAATVVGSLINGNPARRRQPPSRMAPGAEREAGLEDQPSVLRPGCLLRQPHRRAEAPVLAHDDGGFLPLLAGRPHQVHGEADIHSPILPSGVHPAPVDVDSRAPRCLILFVQNPCRNSCEVPAAGSGTPA